MIEGWLIPKDPYFLFVAWTGLHSMLSLGLMAVSVVHFIINQKISWERKAAASKKMKSVV
jgi:hypothetical protein